MVLFSCKNSIEEVKEIGEFEELPVKESYNVIYLRSQHGLVSNRLTAPLLEQYKNKKTIMPQGFLLEFLDSNLNTSAYLQAKYGEIINSENKMIARDSVILVNFKNEELYTEELTWQQDIHGKGLESSEDFSKYVIKKVTGQYFLDEESVESPEKKKDD